MVSKPWKGHLEGVPHPDPDRGPTVNMVINQLPTGMILQAPPPPKKKKQLRIYRYTETKNIGEIAIAFK